MGAARRWSLLLLLLVVVAAGVGGSDPKPRAWPEQFHAVLLTERGGRLQIDDLYYDWPSRRNLNLIRDQLSEDPVWDVEWNNGTSYYFNSTSCRTIHFPVGVLPPDWLVEGSLYLGRQPTDGFDCHVWTKADFITYYEDVLTHLPVRWNFFDGMQQHVMRFEVGVVLEDSKWQAPSYCFAADSNAATGIDGTKDATSLTQFADDLEIPSLRNFAGTASL